MKKHLTKLQIEVICLVCIIGLVLVTGTYLKTNPRNEHPGMIRLHVVANSDSPEDQMIKRKVRNQIITAMEGQTELAAARSYIDTHLEDMEATAEAVIADCGADYHAKAERKVTFIPEKSYEDLTLPAGNYEALRITLGEGKGENWWCVIFPQLCLIGEKADGEKLVLKSRIKELLSEQVE